MIVSENTTSAILGWTHHAPSYYDHLIDWSALDMLLADIHEEHRLEAELLVLQALDHAIAEAVLHQLPTDHHSEFLERCQVEYHNPAILMWLEEKANGISVHIQQTIIVTHTNLAELLADSYDSD
jgi:hypothetical protein